MYPICVGLDRRSATNPRWKTPARIITAPTIRASAEASAIARFGSPPASRSGASVAAIMGPSDESGPSTRILEGPKIAYASRHKMDVYRPVIAGSPASSAYAMPCGTRSAVRIRPATRSLGSHVRR